MPLGGASKGGVPGVSVKGVELGGAEKGHSCDLIDERLAVVLLQEDG